MKLNHTLPTLVLVVATALLTACNSAPEKPDHSVRGDYNYSRDYLSWLVKNKMAEHDIVGLSIALVDDQRVVWAKGFGWADENRRIEAAPETVYRAGSITKLFSATLSRTWN